MVYDLLFVSGPVLNEPAVSSISSFPLTLQEVALAEVQLMIDFSPDLIDEGVALTVTVGFRQLVHPLLPVLFPPPPGIVLKLKLAPLVVFISFLN